MILLPASRVRFPNAPQELDRTHHESQGLSHVLRLAVRAGALAIVWWILTGGDASSWVVGAPAVLASAAASIALRRPEPWRISPSGAARFLPYFAWHTLAGSVDVARRALDPGLPISPSFERYLIRLPGSGPSRVLFVNVVSLLPGTLSADLDGDELTVHGLTDGAETLDRVRALEDRIAAVFGHELNGGDR